MIATAIAGRGRTVVGGKVVDWSPGQVLLGPVGVPHAVEVAVAGPWRIAWVFFDDSVAAPVLHGRHAELVAADAGDFVLVIQILTREAAGAAQQPVMEALVTLLAACARRLAGAGPVDPRLGRLWSQVEADLAHEWSVAELARIACVSEEHLRRLCHRHFQRSPMDHLTRLRLRRAGTMLRSTPEKMEEIARHVGYGSVYSFSAAFHRWSGSPPTRFRREARLGLVRRKPIAAQASSTDA